MQEIFCMLFVTAYSVTVTILAIKVQTTFCIHSWSTSRVQKERKYFLMLLSSLAKVNSTNSLLMYGFFFLQKLGNLDVHISIKFYSQMLLPRKDCSTSAVSSTPLELSGLVNAGIVTIKGFFLDKSLLTDWISEHLL